MDALHELFRMLSNLKFVQPAQLIGLVRIIDWSTIDTHTRHVVIHETSTAITKLREKQGMLPIDDPLPGAPPNAHQVVCKIVTEFPAPAGKAVSAGTNADQ
jgi:hypothetical protein